LTIGVYDAKISLALENKKKEHPALGGEQASLTVSNTSELESIATSKQSLRKRNLFRRDALLGFSRFRRKRTG